jgi:serine/threonine protein kinase
MNQHRASVEDFSMLSVLGKGAFAKVLLVRHNATEKLFAMKIIPKKNVSAKKQEAFITVERNVLV